MLPQDMTGPNVFLDGDLTMGEAALLDEAAAGSARAAILFVAGRLRLPGHTPGQILHRVGTLTLTDFSTLSENLTLFLRMQASQKTTPGAVDFSSDRPTWRSKP